MQCLLYSFCVFVQYFAIRKRIFLIKRYVFLFSDSFQQNRLMTRGFYVIWIVICVLFGIHDNSYAAIQYFSINFHNEAVELVFDDAMLYPYDIKIEEIALKQAYERLEKKPYQVLLEALQLKEKELGLNDWLYGELIRASTEYLYDYGNEAKSELTTYLLLAKSGYDVLLTYRKTSISVNIYVEEILYEVPLIEEAGRQYASLSHRKTKKDPVVSMFLLNHHPNPKGKVCAFEFKNWPTFCQKSSERKISFNFEGKALELNINYSEDIAKLLTYYPLVDEYWYMEAPMSPQLMKSLIPRLKNMIKDRSVRSSLELLVAFTRSGFVYKEDHQAFGKSKPMVADELFYYPFSDCEDRSALFFSLVKVLLDLPMIVIAYEDHLSIAVASPDIIGSAVNYKGRRYIFCDPTGPRSSSEIGIIPEGYENKTFEILGMYNSGQTP